MSQPTPRVATAAIATCGSRCMPTSLLAWRASNGAHAGAPGNTTRAVCDRIRACRAPSSRDRHARASPGRQRRSAPPSSRCVANEWRRRCGWMRSGSSPALSARRRRIEEGAGAGERRRRARSGTAPAGGGGRGTGDRARGSGGGLPPPPARSGRPAPCCPCRGSGRAGSRGRRTAGRAPTASLTRSPAP